MLCLTTSTGLTDPLALPDIGDSSQQVISPAQEKALGRAFMNRLRDTTPLVEDPAVTHYISQLGQKLASHSVHPGQNFTFFVVEDPSINAFAAPGGFIGIHSGLILAARNESELAAVIAHEIAHVTQRHLARAYDNASRMSLPTAAAILAAILIGTQNSEAGQAALMSVQAGSIQQQINFTRGNEEEADRIGMQSLASAGFDPQGMPGFFQRLQQQTRYYGKRPPGFLSTHPVTGDRIAEAYSRIDQLHASPHPDNLNFYLMQVRLRILIDPDPTRVLNLFEKSGEELHLPPQAKHYGLALALLANHQPQRAYDILQSLHNRDPDRLPYRLALAQALQALNRSTEALELLADTVKLYPENPVGVLNYADMLIAAQKFEPAIELLQNAIRHTPGTATLYASLSRAAGNAGRKALAYQANAENLYLSGRLHAAIGQLEQALKLPDIDYYQVSRLEARLQTLKREALESDKN